MRYTIAYESRRRKNLDQPATESNLHTTSLELLPPRNGVYSLAQAQALQRTIQPIRPYDRIHVVNLDTWHEKHVKNRHTAGYSVVL